MLWMRLEMKVGVFEVLTGGFWGDIRVDFYGFGCGMRCDSVRRGLQIPSHMLSDCKSERAGP